MATSMSLQGATTHTHWASRKRVPVAHRPRRSGLHVTALFKRKQAEPIVEAKAAKKTLFGKSKAAAKAKPASPTTEKKQSFLSSVTDALDFSEVRSKSDARLLYDAKYGERKGKLSAEQAAALRRKVGGTARDYWKDWVDVKGDYTDKGYVSSQSNNVTGLPFLIAVVVGMFVALGVVVAQTSS